MRNSGTKIKEVNGVKMFKAFGKWIVAASGVYDRFSQYAAAEQRFQELAQ